MKDKKKPFKETLVGSSLIALASQFNPVLGNVLKGVTNVNEAIEQIGSSDINASQKMSLQEFALKQYEAEVTDRLSARSREARVALAGGSDILFKTVGWGIILCFVLLNTATFGLLGEIPEDMMRAFDRAYGAVTSLMVMVVSYYFGSSHGSKQKTNLMMDK